jgi:hypothetical protein
MTLATLQGMNFSMGDVANALKLKTADTVKSGVQKASEAVDAAASAADAARRKGATAAKKTKDGKDAKDTRGDGGGAPVDPMQWWGALTQQFQEIAANAMKDVAQKAATAGNGKGKAADAAGGAGTAAKNAAPRKSASRKRSTSKT